MVTTLVLLPGLDGSGEMFADFRAALDPGLDVITIAYPKDRILGYSQLADFVVKKLPRDRPFVLLGESFSGPVAIDIAASKPAGLQGVVLCCSFASNPRPLLGLLGWLIPLFPRPERISGIAAFLLFGACSTPYLRSMLRKALSGIAPEVLKARLRSVIDVDFSSRLKQVSVPLLYMQAARDRLVPPRVLHRLQSLAPHLREAKMHGPHCLLQVLPAESAAVVMGFVAASPAQRDHAHLRCEGKKT